MEIFKGKKRIIGIALSIFLVAFAFTLLSVFLSVRRLSTFNEKYGQKEDEKSCYDHPSFQKTVKEITYHEAFINMAETDSIGLIVNLSDSLLQLSLEGVIIHSAHIESISGDGFFSALDICSYQNLFSSPLEITEQHATVEKEPIVVKQAPKSEAEALASAAPYAADSVKAQQIADIELMIGAGFEVYIYDSSAGCKRASKHIGIQGETWKNIKRMVQLKRPQYQPAIHICVSKNDALSIYRALPRKALMIMKI
ncbi:MAG: hypothetical protein RBS73_10885 [Prolixibacteraceae bacterium]|jgi:hypothetical protein|nr:hypothetical protein [Prolixibacteraceae bacterium]